VHQHIEFVRERKNKPEIIHKQLTDLLGEVSVDDFGRSSDVVALMVRRDRADQAFFYEDAPMMSF
jgi:hypothetical protein